MNPNLVLERQEVVLLKHSWVPYMAWLHICMTATLTLHFLLFLVSSFWRKTNFGCTNKIFKLMHHTAGKLDFQFKIQFSCLFGHFVKIANARDGKKMFWIWFCLTRNRCLPQCVEYAKIIVKFSLAVIYEISQFSAHIS